MNDQLTRDSGQGTITLQTHGKTETLDITLPGQGQQGTVMVTAQDANDQLMNGASVSLSVTYGAISGTTRSSGSFLFGNVRAGPFSVTATAAGLTGSATGSLAAGAVAYVTVKIEPTATNNGIVYGPAGSSEADLPQKDIRVYLNLNCVWPYYTTVADGKFAFEGLKLVPISCSVLTTAPDSSGQR